MADTDNNGGYAYMGARNLWKISKLSAQILL